VAEKAMSSEQRGEVVQCGCPLGAVHHKWSHAKRVARNEVEGDGIRVPSGQMEEQEREVSRRIKALTPSAPIFTLLRA
jgi:hypothetical protein